MSKNAIHSVTCPYCGSKAEFFRSSKIVYGRDYGPIYACLPCEAWVGTHKRASSDKYRPLGRLANKELREAKMAAHAAFDPLWRDGEFIGNRRGAYNWLAEALGIDVGQCHVGEFDIEMCRKVVEVCKSRRLVGAPE